MTEARMVHEAALQMREFARDTGIPDYAEMFTKAARDLDKRELELRRLKVPLIVPGKVD